jgi:UDPglucose 6-dehydrogenase
MDKGAIIKAHDPEGLKEAKHLLPEKIVYCEGVYETFAGADAVVLMTEWNQYRGLDLAKVKSLMKGKVFIDLRNVYEHAVMLEHGFEYVCVGR